MGALCRSSATVLGFGSQKDLKDQQTPPTSDLPSEPTTMAATFNFRALPPQPPRMPFNMLTQRQDECQRADRKLDRKNAKKQKLYNLTQNPMSVRVLDLCDSDWSGDLLLLFLHSSPVFVFVGKKTLGTAFHRLGCDRHVIAESWIC